MIVTSSVLQRSGRSAAHPHVGNIIGRSVLDIHDALGVSNDRFLAGLEKARQEKVRFPLKLGGGRRASARRPGPSPATPTRPAGYLFVASTALRWRPRRHARNTAARRRPESGGDHHQQPAGHHRIRGQRLFHAEHRLHGRRSHRSAGRLPALGQTGRETYAALWQALCAGRDWRGELLNRRKNGRLYWDDVHIVPLMNAAGKVAHHLSIQEDISERKRNEDTLRLWATVFENSGEAVMITDAGNRIVSVNQAFTDITGFAPGEVIGEQPSILGSGRHEPAFFADMWHKLKTGGHWLGDLGPAQERRDLTRNGSAFRLCVTTGIN